MKEHFTIGDMAEYSGLSAKKLRYYDEMGILSPRIKDPKSGYRYYTFTEFERSILLKTMRDLNFSLVRIKKEFANMTTERYIELMKIRADDLAKRIQRLKSSLEFLDARIDELNTVLSIPKDKCFFRTLGPIKGIEYPVESQSLDALRQRIREIEREHDDGRNISIILRVNSKENIEKGRLTDYSSFFAMLNDYTGYEDMVKVIPERLYASCFCSVSKQKSLKSWQKLINFISESGYEICGDAIKRIVIEQGVIIKSNEYVSMLAIPVREKKSEEII